MSQPQTWASLPFPSPPSWFLNEAHRKCQKGDLNVAHRKCRKGDLNEAFKRKAKYSAVQPNLSSLHGVSH